MNNFLKISIVLGAIMSFATGTSDLSASSPNKRIALLVKATHNPFYDLILLGSKERAAEFHFDLFVAVGKDEDDWQSQIEFLKNEADQFDGFILVPTRSEGFGEVLRELAKKKKPVVAVDTPLRDGDENILTTVSSDNVLGGAIAATYLVQQIKKQSKPTSCVVLVTGNPKAKTHQDRVEGFTKVIREKLPSIKIPTFIAMSSFYEGHEVGLENMMTLQKCGFVFSTNDTMVLGILKAFEEKRTPAPVLVGYDAILEVQRKILEGTLAASVQQSPAQMGNRAMEALNDFFAGKSVDKKLTVIPKLSVRQMRLNTLTKKDLELFDTPSAQDPNEESKP